MKSIFPPWALIASTVLSVMLANSSHFFKFKDDSGKNIPFYCYVLKVLEFITVWLLFIHVLMCSILCNFRGWNM